LHLTQQNKKKQDHTTLFSKLVKQTNQIMIIIRVGLCWLTQCLTGTFWLTDQDAKTKPLNCHCPGWNGTNGKHMHEAQFDCSRCLI